MTAERLDLVGAITAYVIFLASIIVFVARIADEPEVERVAGVIVLLTTFPLVYLLSTGPSVDRPPLYYVQISIMILWIVILFIVDYYPGYGFRERLPLVIGFVVLYFAGLGGMLGVASMAGRVWMLGAIGLFFATATLAFVSRWVAGI